VSAAAEAASVHTGAASDWAVREPSSSTPRTPTDFWASLAPWLNASNAEVGHCTRRTNGFRRAVARPSPRRAPRSIAQAAPKPNTGGTARANSAPITPVGCPPPTLPQLIAPNPASTTPAPTSPRPGRGWNWTAAPAAT
jgi:hypothetical protein